MLPKAKRTVFTIKSVMQLHKLESHCSDLITASYHVSSVVQVVEYLLWNSIEAMSTRIDVRLEPLGVVVEDNGRGIDSQELASLGEEAVTSDPERKRGLTLVTLARLCTLEIESKRHEIPASYKRVAFGQATTVEASARVDAGTIMTVKDLFRHLPVRRNGLANALETFCEVRQVLTQLSLLFVGSSFTLSDHSSRQVTFPASVSLRKKLNAIAGGVALVNIDHFRTNIGVSGAMTTLTSLMPTKGHQHLFINGLSAKCCPVINLMNHAFDLMTTEAGMAKGFPAFALFLSVPTSSFSVVSGESDREAAFVKTGRVLADVLDAVIDALSRVTQEIDVRETLAASRRVLATSFRFSSIPKRIRNGLVRGRLSHDQIAFMHHTKGLSTNRSPKLNEDEQMNEKLASEKSNQIEKKDSNQICTDPTENLLIRSTKGTTPESPRSPITKLTRAMEGSPHDVEPDTKRSKEVVMPVNDDSVEEVFRFEYTADRTSSEDRALLLPSAESAMVTSPPIRHRALDGLRSTPKPASARVTSLTRRLRQHIRRNPYFMDSLPGPPMIEDPQPTPEAEVHSRKRIALGTPTISPKRLKLHDLPRVDRFKATKDTLQQMEVIGQVDHSFILCRLEGQLLAVDQHAVGERVNLERFAAEQRELPPDRASQPVDFTLNVSPDDSFHLTSLQSQLASWGFEFTVDDLDVKVTRIPVIRGTRVAPNALCADVQRSVQFREASGLTGMPQSVYE